MDDNLSAEAVSQRLKAIGTSALEGYPCELSDTDAQALIQAAATLERVERLRVYVNNPSAWDQYDEGVSEAALAALSAPAEERSSGASLDVSPPTGSALEAARLQALLWRIGERVADEVEKVAHGRQSDCEAAASDIYAMLSAPKVKAEESSAYPSPEQIARAIAESYGVDPDDHAPLAVMCTAQNKPVAWWKVYEEQAEAVLAILPAPAESSEQPSPPASPHEWMFDGREMFCRKCFRKTAAPGREGSEMDTECLGLGKLNITKVTVR